MTFLPFIRKISVPYSVKAVTKNKKIKDHKNPDDSSNKALPGFLPVYQG
jgi:hypothetical protein